MQRIIAPLHPGDRNDAVANLQDALRLLAERGRIALDPPERDSLLNALMHEHGDLVYADATRRLVILFRVQHGLNDLDWVDDPTAAVLNDLLRELGALDNGLPVPERMVAGQVVSSTRQPLPSVAVTAVHMDGAYAIRLGEDNTDAEGRYTIRYELLPEVDSINLRVAVFDADGKTLRDSDVIRGAKPLEIVDIIVPSIDITPYRVEGKVASRISASVGGLRVVIVDKGVGGDVQLAETSTDEGGAYQATFSDSEVRQRGKAQPDVQARVFAGDAFVGASDVHYNASQHETLNLLLEDQAASALKSEYEVLTGALASQFTGKLGDLKETDEQQDITYLANKTGWDARAVALAALADQFSAGTMDANGAPTIPQAYFYALFRAGLPANEDTLYHTDARTLKAVWKQAAEQGVIPTESADQISNLVERFQALSAQKLLTGPALVGASSLKEMLTISRLDDAQQATFAQLYATNRADMPTFWKAAGDAFGQDVANRLQVDGKLGFLTINNAHLMQKVHTMAGANGLSDPLQLAQMGYHRAEPWSQLLTADVPIPNEIPGDTPESKQANYAEYLAAQVRLSYPTAAVAQMVKSGELPLTGAANGVSDQVHAFLTQHQGKFEIGVQPVQQYIAQNNLQIAEETVKQVKRLQRVYQITPSDQALTGLMKRGIDAAYHVVRYDKYTFVQNFAADIGGTDNAALTYDRSVQIHNAVLNIALSYLNARTAPAIGVHSPPSVLDPVPTNAGDVIAYATLESLFGSMDFCACDHCRSILSPAAYLVDLLLFLDQPKPAAGTENPQTVLLERRPDIQCLPLTCENTNTALPYIDVVNETLEYFVANAAANAAQNPPKPPLDGYVGYDSNGIASEDLLASPQFVIDAAYTTLQGEHFPAPLPFHQPLEYLRRYFNKFEVPLPLAMERLRKNDDLERGANPYDWRDTLMEELDLSRAEYDILTTSNVNVNDELKKIFGFPSTETAPIDKLSNAKQFTRRIWITYDDLVAILRTRFVNPNSDLIPKLERLGISFATLDALHKNPQGITDADFNKLLPTGAAAIDVTEFGGNVANWENDNHNYAPIIRTWLNSNNNANYARIMGLITLTVPAGTWAASKVYAIGDCARPTAAQVEPTLYYECTTSGTSAASEPKWPTIPGNTYTDGTAVWTCRDASSCLSFDNLAFRYSDPAKLTQNMSAVEFVRLLRFIRLWKKLGWTIEQTDTAICALYRADLVTLDASDINDVSNLNTGFLNLLPRLGIIVRVMKALNLTLKRDLFPLLTCWSEIGTHGDSALYRQMFLNPALLKQDADFADNGYGEFLTNPKLNLAAHAVVLRSAFNLSGDEYDQIVDALQDTLDTENKEPTLTMRNISAIFRRGWLARKLKLSVRELLLLTKLTGLDPFATLNTTDPAIVHLIELVQSMKDRSFKSAAALYLIWNQDLSGKSAPDSAQVAAFARTLRLGLTAVEGEFAVADDPDGTIARARMALVYGNDATNLFFGFLDNTFVTDVQYNRAAIVFVTHVPYHHNQATLEQAILDAAPNQIAYDDATKMLSFNGILTDTVRNALKKIAGVTDDFKNAVDALYTENQQVVQANLEQPIVDTVPGRIYYDDFRKRLYFSGILTDKILDTLINVQVNGAALSQEFTDALHNLYQENQKVVAPFFARYPELQPLYDAYVADTTHSAAEKRSNLLKAILPELVQRRKRQQALQSVSAVANTDLAFTQAFLDPAAAPFPLHPAGHGDQPALNDLLALENPGLSVQFFASDTATGTTIPSPDIATMLDYAPAGGRSGNPLPANPTPGAAISGVWRGYLEAPESGFFNLHIEADAGTSVMLLLDGKPVTLMQEGATLWKKNADPIELRAGTLYAISLTVEKVRNVVRVQWEWEPKGQGRAVIPSRYFYPSGPFEAFKEAYVRFLKVASLATGLGLTANELAYFATHADYRINAQGQIDSNGQGWLNALPNADNLHLTNPADAAVAKNLNAALLMPLRALLDFARIKADISPSDESLLSVLKDPTTATHNTDSLLFTITRWNQTSLNDVLAQLSSNIAGLGHFELFRRVYYAFALIQKMGISASALIQATTNDPTSNTVRDLQAALRARYDAADWRDVVRPINDEMRSLQRDALVAYILHQMRSNPASAHIDTADKLFEYFLMDVQMDPCMQTSRIRHALSSVQLFIERCLMNLEPRVSSAAINAKQWEWMKRYRVWEANRKVYLFPENWLEPELRDDKSPFFKEIESELLQSDITEDSAATALLNYLSKLEEVAKLEPCGIYHIPADPAKRAGEINHIIARTAGAHRKYYYRRYEYGYWTPWEQIKLDIEDNPVIPVVWKDRLFLFWLRILKQAPMKTPSAPPPGQKLQDLDASTVITSNVPKMTVQAALCWSEYYNGKWQPTKTSDVNLPATIDPPAGTTEFIRNRVRLSVAEIQTTLPGTSPSETIGALKLAIDYPGGGSHFVLYNTHTLPVRADDDAFPPPPPPMVFAIAASRTFRTGSQQFEIDYAYTFGTKDWSGNWKYNQQFLPRTVLGVWSGTDYGVIEPQPYLLLDWFFPFFFQDRLHTFFVTSRSKQVWIDDYNNYGVSTERAVTQDFKIPSLVLQVIDSKTQIKPKFWGDGPIGPDPGVVDPVPMQRFITEDAYIRKGIGITGSVLYGGKQIGPPGAINTNGMFK